MTKTTGFPRSRVQREVERYCISIGQACSYKVGHLAWLRAREKEKTLGAKFDIHQFHEVLKDGAMPLTILERPGRGAGPGAGLEDQRDIGSRRAIRGREPDRLKPLAIARRTSSRSAPLALARRSTIERICVSSRRRRFPH